MQAAGTAGGLDYKGDGKMKIGWKKRKVWGTNTRLGKLEIGTSILALLIALAILPVIPVCAANDIVLYVSPDGSDTDGNGGLDFPYATITRARDAVRTLRQSGRAGNVVVELRGGTYYVDSGIVFDQRDSAGDGFTTTYRAYRDETPVFVSRREAVSGWEEQGDGIWSAKLRTNGQFYRLYENETIGNPARYPDEGYLKAVSSPAADGIAKNAFCCKREDFKMPTRYSTLEAVLWPGGDSGEWNWFENIIPVVKIDANEEEHTFTEYEDFSDASRFPTGGPNTVKTAELSGNGCYFVKDGQDTCLKLQGSGENVANASQLSRQNLHLEGDITYTTTVKRVGNTQGGRCGFYIGRNQMLLVGGNLSCNIQDPVTGESKTFPLGACQENTWYQVKFKLYFDEVQKKYLTYDVWLDGFKKNTTPLLIREPFERLDSFLIASFYNLYLGEPAGANQFWIKDYRLEAERESHYPTVTLKNNASYTIGTGSRYYLQGARDFLDHPGEFFYDSANGRVDYIPHGPITENTEIIIPASDHIFRFEGAGEKQPVKGITLQGVEIHGTDRGYSGVRIKNANNIRVLDCRIYNVGDRGIHMTGRTTDCEFAGNEIFNAGESGMEIDLALQTNEAKNGYSRIVNNHIYNVGQIYGQGSCIHLNNSAGNYIANNLLHGSRRYGIGMVSSRPGTLIGQTINGILVTQENVREFTHTQDNIIEYNDIYDCISDSQDCGPINSWGIDGGNVIRYNAVHDSIIPFSFGTGIYLDDASDHETVTGNLVYNIRSAPGARLYASMFAKGIGNKIENNIFADNQVSGQTLGVVTTNAMGGEGCYDLFFNRNIGYRAGKKLYHFANWQEDRFTQADYNLFYDGSDDVTLYSNTGAREEPFADWRSATGFDTQSLITDPLFMEPDKNDYRLQLDSPAYRLGFQDIWLENIGLLPSFRYADPSEPVERLFIKPAGTQTNTGGIRLSAGETVQTTLLARSRTGYCLDGITAHYTGYDTDVIKVDADGTITAKAPGRTEIIVTMNGADVSTRLQVEVGGTENDVLFYNRDGIQLSNVYGESYVKAKFTVTGQDDVAGLPMILAQYSARNEMKRMVTGRLTKQNNTLELDDLNWEAGDCIKAFVFEGFDSLRPVIFKKI